MPAAPALTDSRLKAIPHRAVSHRRASSLEEAASLRGLEPSAVIKTMVVRRGEDDFVFVLVPGDRVIAWPKLREALGARRLSLPDADQALAATGYPRGTITPFGAARDWPVVADARLSEGAVSIGGGVPGLSVMVEGTDLIGALEATVADVTDEQA